jgi:hypothetical protein
LKEFIPRRLGDPAAAGVTRRRALPLHATRHEWVLKSIIEFESTADLLHELPDKIVTPAEKRVQTEQTKLKELYESMKRERI